MASEKIGRKLGPQLVLARKSVPRILRKNENFFQLIIEKRITFRILRITIIAFSYPIIKKRQNYFILL